MCAKNRNPKKMSATDRKTTCKMESGRPDGDAQMCSVRRKLTCYRSVAIRKCHPHWRFTGASQKVQPRPPGLALCASPSGPFDKRGTTKETKDTKPIKRRGDPRFGSTAAAQLKADSPSPLPLSRARERELRIAIGDYPPRLANSPGLPEKSGPGHTMFRLFCAAHKNSDGSYFDGRKKMRAFLENTRRLWKILGVFPKAPGSAGGGAFGGVAGAFGEFSGFYKGAGLLTASGVFQIENCKLQIEKSRRPFKSLPEVLPIRGPAGPSFRT